MRRSVLILALLVLALSTFVVPEAAHSSHATTRVYINGRPTTVHFNDGDSFRQLDGPYAGRGSRLAGFNTLESFGPSHSWGGWHPFELWVNAKMATYNGRQGVWHCTGDGSTDTYGRVLLDCPDLAVDQIRRGFAHAMQIDDTTARPEYLRAQQEAIRNRRGMWAKGVPPFVLTSLHSASEDPTRGDHSNRLVSTRDGHSERWSHNDTYDECSFQCSEIIVADATRVQAYARRLRREPALVPVLEGVANIHLIEAVERYARLEQLPEYLPAAVQTALEPRLAEARENGQLGTTRLERGACMVYTDFRRRFGRERASCMRDRGLTPPPFEGAPGVDASNPGGTQ